MNELLATINKAIDCYLIDLQSNKKTFADVSRELHQQRFDHSKSDLEIAVLNELQIRNQANAMKKII
ncbi:hypothetical protein [Lapidilactobacillus wuchangensis]|uniref:hypothetical protein n=1 Tax=Lapidilactobacillus wuchangensis TaxID=2486001 RepID=UPI000F76B088|nr:hypothetical protein [Lapidilactobacillus wuchangensis]